MTTREDFDARKSEIEAYLRIIKTLDEPESSSVRRGVFEPQQRNILHSVTFLLLYNLVESTVRNCVENLVRRFSGMKISDIRSQSEDIREKWLQLSAGTHGASTNESERISAVKKLLSTIIQDKAIDVEYPLRRKHGNFNDHEIEEVANVFGVSLEIPSGDLRREIKGGKRIYSVVEKRNQLAHGEASFSDCGRELSYEDLRKTAEVTFNYLEIVINSFDNHWNGPPARRNE